MRKTSELVNGHRTQMQIFVATIICHNRNRDSVEEEETQMGAAALTETVAVLVMTSKYFEKPNKVQHDQQGLEVTE